LLRVYILNSTGNLETWFLRYFRLIVT
jgi:hypothetical protein